MTSSEKPAATGGGRIEAAAIQVAQGTQTKPAAGPDEVRRLLTMQADTVYPGIAMHLGCGARAM